MQEALHLNISSSIWTMRVLSLRVTATESVSTVTSHTRQAQARALRRTAIFPLIQKLS